MKQEALINKHKSVLLSARDRVLRCSAGNTHSGGREGFGLLPLKLKLSHCVNALGIIIMLGLAMMLSGWSSGVSSCVAHVCERERKKR